MEKPHFCKDFENSGSYKKESMKKIIKPYLDFVFPVTCVCCGQSLQKTGRYVCNWCSSERFEPVEQEGNEILPEHILFRYSLWQFDKGGVLQELLHQLKYQNLRMVGEELGRIAARAFLKSPDNLLLSMRDHNSPILVPVPLHTSKRRKRGYNQARAIACGLSEVLGWPLAGKGEVVRTRKTKTQTGLNTAQRSKNVRGAFCLKNPDCLLNFIPVIVDDVFTTGATTFELAEELNQAIPGRYGIITVAKA